MLLLSFCKLVDILQPLVLSNKLQSFRSTGGNTPIVPELVVGARLRFLGGSAHKDIADMYGISKKSAQQVVNKFINAVDQTLEIKIPTTQQELEQCANDWHNLSGASEIYSGVVGAIDGWLCCTN